MQPKFGRACALATALLGVACGEPDVSDPSGNAEFQAIMEMSSTLPPEAE